MGVVEDFRLEWFIFHCKNFYIIENLISHAFQCQIIGLMENKLVVILSEQDNIMNCKDNGNNLSNPCKFN